MQGNLVRLAGVEDAVAIAQVHRLSRASYYGLSPGPSGEHDQMWSDLVAEPGRTTHVVESPGGVLGFVSSIRLSSPRRLELTSLYVLPSHIGGGVGAILYNEFDRELSPGHVGLLEVWAWNHRAIDFYLCRGWTPTSRTRPGPQGVDYVNYELNR